MQRLCKYSAEPEAEKRIKELVLLTTEDSIENLMKVGDMVKYAILEPELFEDKKALIIR